MTTAAETPAPNAERDAPLFLRPLLVTGGSQGTPKWYDKVSETWARADQLAESGEHLGAGAAFYGLTLPLVAETGLALRVRAAAYDNAASCWIAARAFDLARRRLKEAAERDPAAHTAIEAALARVP